MKYVSMSNQQSYIYETIILHLTAHRDNYIGDPSQVKYLYTVCASNYNSYYDAYSSRDANRHLKLQYLLFYTWKCGINLQYSTVVLNIV